MKYTEQELKELPMTKEEVEGIHIIAKGRLINNVKFWIIMTGLVLAVKVLLEVPEAIRTMVYGYFKVNQ